MRPLAASMVAEKDVVYTLNGRHVKEKTALRLSRADWAADVP